MQKLWQRLFKQTWFEFFHGDGIFDIEEVPIEIENDSFLQNPKQSLLYFSPSERNVPCLLRKNIAAGSWIMNQVQDDPAGRAIT